jgi:hypothetical protein
MPASINLTRKNPSGVNCCKKILPVELFPEKSQKADLGTSMKFILLSLYPLTRQIHFPAASSGELTLRD